MVEQEKEPLISRATVNSLREVLSNKYVLTSIRQLFDAQGVDYDENYSPTFSPGARRLEADRYLRTLDLTTPRDAQRLAKIIQTVLFIHHTEENIERYEDLLALKSRIISDGYTVVNSDLISVVTPIHTSVIEVIERLDLQFVRREWERALREVASDPADAVTAACALLESVCKEILDRLGQPYPSEQDVQHLYRAVSGALDLSPDTRVEAELKRIYGGAANIVAGIGVLRTKVGDAHGKGQADPIVRLDATARFAVQLAGATAVFLVEILEQRLQQSE